MANLAGEWYVHGTRFGVKQMYRYMMTLEHRPIEDEPYKTTLTFGIEENKQFISDDLERYIGTCSNGLIVEGYLTKDGLFYFYQKVTGAHGDALNECKCRFPNLVLGTTSGEGDWVQPNRNAKKICGIWSQPHYNSTGHFKLTRKIVHWEFMKDSHEFKSLSSIGIKCFEENNVISEVTKGTVAEEKGINVGWIILTINNHEIKTQDRKEQMDGKNDSLPPSKQIETFINNVARNEKISILFRIKLPFADPQLEKLFSEAPKGFNIPPQIKEEFATFTMEDIQNRSMINEKFCQELAGTDMGSKIHSLLGLHRGNKGATFARTGSMVNMMGGTQPIEMTQLNEDKKDSENYEEKKKPQDDSVSDTEENPYKEMIDHVRNNDVWLVKPNNTKIIYWDFWVLLLSMFVAIVIPWHMAFKYPTEETGYMFAFQRIADITFFADMILNFFIVYFDHTHGKYVRDIMRIADHYIKTWFIFDLLAAIPFSMSSSYIINAAMPIGQIYWLRLLNLFRIIKFIRCIPLDRIQKRVEIHFGINSACITALNAILVTVILSHWGACLWGMIPHLTEYPSLCDTWMIAIGVMAEPSCDANATASGDQYLASLYWSIMTLSSVGYGDIPATTSGERVIAICWMMVGGAFYAYIVGAICCIGQQNNIAEGQCNKDMDNLNNFMKDNHFSARAKKYYREFFIKKGCKHYTREDFTKVLTNMSPGLRMNIVKEGNHFKDVQMFKKPVLRASERCQKSAEERKLWDYAAAEESERLVSMLAQRVKVFSYPKAEVIVNNGELATKLYVITKGNASLWRTRVFDMEMVGELLCVGKVSVFGEDMILKNHRRRYSVVALTFMDVVFLEKKDLQEVLDQNDFPKMKKQIRKHVVKLAFINGFVEYAFRKREEKKQTQEMAKKLAEMKVSIQVKDTFRTSFQDYGPKNQIEIKEDKKTEMQQVLRELETKHDKQPGKNEKIIQEFVLKFNLCNSSYGFDLIQHIVPPELNHKFEKPCEKYVREQNKIKLQAINQQIDQLLTDLKARAGVQPAIEVKNNTPVKLEEKQDVSAN